MVGSKKSPGIYCSNQRLLCIGIGRIFFNLFLLVCLLNVFYIPVIYTDRFFTPGMLWLVGVVSPFLGIYLFFFSERIRLPVVGIYLGGLIIGYALYAWVRGNFSMQQIVFLIGLYLLLVVVANSGGKLYLSDVCVLLVGIGVVESLWGIGQYFGWCEVYHSSFGVTGTFDNPAGLAIFLVAVFPFVFPFVFSRQGYKQITGILAGGILITAILLSGSRTGAMALVVVVLIGCLYYGKLKRHTRRWLYFGGIFLGLLLLIGLYYVKKDSADGRLLIWRTTLQMIREKPLLGHGPGSFGGDYMLYQADYLSSHPDDRQDWLADNVKHPFNEYLKIWAEYGILGLALLGIGMKGLFRASSGKALENRPALLSLIALAACSMFSYPMNYPAVCILLFMHCGWLLRQGKGFFIGRKESRIVGIFLVAGLLAFAIYWKRMETNWYRVSRQALAGKSEQMLPYYVRMYAFMRENPLFLYNYGAELHEAGQWSESIRILEECSGGMNDTDVQMLLADNYSQMKEFRKAEHHYLLTSRMCPNRFLPLYHLVKLYDQTGRQDEARRLALQIIDKPIKVPSYTVDKIKREMEEYLQENFKHILR